MTAWITIRCDSCGQTVTYGARGISPRTVRIWTKDDGWKTLYSALVERLMGGRPYRVAMDYCPNCKPPKPADRIAPRNA